MSLENDYDMSQIDLAMNAKRIQDQATTNKKSKQPNRDLLPLPMPKEEPSFLNDINAYIEDNENSSKREASETSKINKDDNDDLYDKYPIIYSRTTHISSGILLVIIAIVNFLTDVISVGQTQNVLTGPGVGIWSAVFFVFTCVPMFILAAQISKHQTIQLIVALVVESLFGLILGGIVGTAMSATNVSLNARFALFAFTCAVGILVTGIHLCILSFQMFKTRYSGPIYE